MQKATIYISEDLIAAREKAKVVFEKFNEIRLSKAAGSGEKHVEETLVCYGFPGPALAAHHNLLERIIRQNRRRTRVVRLRFPVGGSVLMLVAVRLRHIATKMWDTRRYLKMGLLDEFLEADAVVA